MIKVTRLNDTEFWVNADQIEFVEETPDTIVSLVSGRKVIVLQSAREIIDQVIAYHRYIVHTQGIPQKVRMEE